MRFHQEQVQTGDLPQIIGHLKETDLVLDVGGWARPLARADWLIDLLPYETRGMFGTLGDEPERFTRDTWVTRDLCSRERWPFDDDHFDFVFCSHTLEDVRDPVWVCSEMNRVGKAGYIETPSPQAELCRGVESRYWIGHGHHRWLVSWESEILTFEMKPHFVHHPWRFHLSSRRRLRSDVPLRTAVHWQTEFEYREHIELDGVETQRKLQALVDAAARPLVRDTIMSAARRLSRFRSTP